MAKQLLGKEVTAALNEKLAARCTALRGRGVVPKLAIVRCGEQSSDLSYERGAMKRAADIGVDTESVVLPETVSKEELLETLDRLNGDPSVHGVLLFRPLPKALRPYESEICNRLLPKKDVDCMTDLSGAGVYAGKDLGYPPCTPQAVMEILAHYDIDLTGKNVCVIGRSLVVGKPVSMMLLKKNATVTMCHTKTRDLRTIAKRSDIIVTSAGVLGSLTADFVSPGQIVIDVSINWDPAKKEGRGGIAGDALYEEVEKVVDAITPVPGGVGSVTTSVLIGHVVDAAERAARS